MSDQYIITAHLRAELNALYEVIRAIWCAAADDEVTELQQQANIEQMVYDAIQLLPAEYRTPDMPPVVDSGKTETMSKVRKRFKQASFPEPNVLEDLF